MKEREEEEMEEREVKQKKLEETGEKKGIDPTIQETSMDEVKQHGILKD